MKKMSLLMIISFLFIVSSIALAQQAPIQSQPSSDGNLELALTEVKQKNEVVTVEDTKTYFIVNDAAFLPRGRCGGFEIHKPG